MKKTITICDKCGKEIPEGVSVQIIEGIDICAKCWPKMKAVLLEWLNAETEKQTAKAAQADKQKAAAPKPPAVDLGKMQALRDAGWSMEKIAEEMGCDKAFVKEHTHAPEKKKRYPLESFTNDVVIDPHVRGVMEAKPGKEEET